MRPIEKKLRELIAAQAPVLAKEFAGSGGPRVVDLMASIGASGVLSMQIANEFAKSATADRRDLLAELAAIKSRVATLDGKAAAPSEKCAPTRWRFDVIRDDDGNLTTILATPEAVQ